MLSEVQSKSCYDMLMTSLTRNSHSDLRSSSHPHCYTTIFLHVTHSLCPTFLVKGLTTSASRRSESFSEKSSQIRDCLRVRLKSRKKINFFLKFVFFLKKNFFLNLPLCDSVVVHFGEKWTRDGRGHHQLNPNIEKLKILP